MLGGDSIHVDLVFSGDGPHREFVEAEINGKGVNVGEWFKRDDGLQALRITPGSILAAWVGREGS